MQNVKFNNVDDFLDFLPPNELQITLYLMELVESSILQHKRKLSYNVPFYSNKRSICFIWPASVLWGKQKTYEGVRFGFTKGYLMQDEINYLEQGDRKQVFWRDFKSIKDIDVDIIKAYLFEAVEIDKSFTK
ncbi:MAG: DUF1801 domain-containing protein [Vicingaceae bacterium]|nr:DUF1801 domain-containing protein [Vicingaceae bacterium]